MAQAVAARTVALTVERIAELGGWIKNRGVATAGATTSLTDATKERTPTTEDDEIVSRYIYLTAGTGVGEFHEITSYGTIGVMTWAVAGTAPDTTTDWITLSIDPDKIIKAMARVTESAAKLQAIRYDFLGLMTNNLLGYRGGFEEFANGASSAPDGWVLSGASASVAEITTAALVAHGLSSVGLTSASAEAILTYTFPPDIVRGLSSHGLRLLGRMAADAAADAQVRVTSKAQGVTAANTNRVGTYTSNEWEELEDISTSPITMPELLVTLEMSFRVITGTNTSYLDHLGLFGPKLDHQDIPATMIGADKSVAMNRGYASTIFDQSKLLNPENWEFRTRAGSTQRGIWFKQPLPDARDLIFTAYRAPDVISTATANVEPNPEWLAYAVARNLLTTEVAREGEAENVPRLLREVQHWFNDRDNLDNIEPNRLHDIAWAEAI